MLLITIGSSVLAIQVPKDDIDQCSILKGFSVTLGTGETCVVRRARWCNGIRTLLESSESYADTVYRADA